jgi:hypothetical protein
VWALADVCRGQRSYQKEARAKVAYLDSLIHPDLALSWLQMSLGGINLSAYPLDGPLPDTPDQGRPCAAARHQRGHRAP